MRDFSFCSTKSAIKISDASCSGSGSGSPAGGTSLPATLPTSSVQNSVTSIYAVTLTSLKDLIVTLSWSTHVTSGGPCLCICFNDDPEISFKLNTSSRFLRKKKGSKKIESGDSKIEIFWDLSAARYHKSGPEPVEKYYLVVAVNGELCLCLGDMGADAAARKLKSGFPRAKFTLLSRREVLFGNKHYSTTAQLVDAGDVHEILIRCREAEGSKSAVLSVWIDKKTVMNVKRLQWNFRGNQTISVDGLLVDLMWDVHDWFYAPPELAAATSAGNAVFMFRTRSASSRSKRMILPEKVTLEEDDGFEFSLLICAHKQQ